MCCITLTALPAIPSPLVLKSEIWKLNHLEGSFFDHWNIVSTRSIRHHYATGKAGRQNTKEPVPAGITERQRKRTKHNMTTQAAHVRTCCFTGLLKMQQRTFYMYMLYPDARTIYSLLTSHRSWKGKMCCHSYCLKNKQTGGQGWNSVLVDPVTVI